MRGTVVACIILLSVLLVWLEAAVVAVWGHMDFSQGQALPWPQAVPPDWPPQPHSVMYCDSSGLAGEWYSAHGQEPSNGLLNPTLYRLVKMRVGWPIRTFQFERTLVLPDPRGTIGWMMDDPVSVWSGGLPVPYRVPKPDEALTEAPCIRRVPIRPCWTGFFVSTGLHALALAGLAAAPPWMVHRLRRLRGQCTICGYDLRGMSVCPECGTRQRP